MIDLFSGALPSLLGGRSRVCLFCEAPLGTTDRRRKFCDESCSVKHRLAKDRERMKRERDRRNAYATEYRAKNPEKVKAAIKRSRSSPEGKAKKAETDAAWYEANKEYAHALQAKNRTRSRLIEPWRTILHAARSRARIRNQPFNLTFEWAEARWTGRCEISNLPFALNAKEKAGTIYSPSIDKIDPKKGYTQDNCRFILFALNAFKHDGSDEDMMKIAVALIGYNRQ